MDRNWLSAIAFWCSFQITPRRITRLLEAKGVREQNNLEFVSPETVKLSAVQLPVRKYQNIADYAGEMYRLAVDAAESGAQLVVFPEYVGLLAATILPGYEKMIAWAADGENLVGLSGVKLVPERVRTLAEIFHPCLYEAYMYTFSTIARLLKIYLVAGTSLFWETDGLHNRCMVFGPNGEAVGTQEKISAIGLDKALGVVASDEIELIDTPMGKLAVVIGSDNYYFECAKIARARGAKILAVPDSRDGVMRDLLRCRADEQNLYAVYSCLAAEREGTTTRAGIFGPMEATAERDGILICAQGAQAQAVTTRTNLEKLERVLEESEPNQAFLRGDYLHSYRYCGTPPLTTTEL